MPCPIAHSRQMKLLHIGANYPYLEVTSFIKFTITIIMLMAACLTFFRRLEKIRTRVSLKCLDSSTFKK